MRWFSGWLLVLACCTPGCAVEEAEAEFNVTVEPTEEVLPQTDYTDWSLEQSGTTAKPGYGKGCRYRFSEESVWELQADGANDQLGLVGPAASDVNLTLTVWTGTSASMSADVVLSRVLSGKAYYEAQGAVTFSGDSADTWTVLDGTLCFASNVVGATEDIPGEFSLIAQRDADGEMRTVGGTFTLPVDNTAPDSELNISDDSIALDLR